MSSSRSPTRSTGVADLLRPAAQRLDPGQQLLEGERLGDVVVRAGAQRLHLEVHRVLGGEHQHRGAVAAVAQRAQHLEAVHLRAAADRARSGRSARPRPGAAPPCRHRPGPPGSAAPRARASRTGRRSGRPRRPGSSWARPAGRHAKVEPRPGALSTSIRPPWLLHDPVADRQAEPGAPARRLGGVERLEDLRLVASCGMPTPVSSISTITSSARCAHGRCGPSACPPGSIASTAFSMQRHEGLDQLLAVRQDGAAVLARAPAPR